MYIMYIDESGDTMILSDKGKKHLVLTGCIVHEKDKLDIEKSCRKIKIEFYNNPNVEVKSTFLRYANPDISIPSPIKLPDRKRYDELEKEITLLLQIIPITLVSIVINKAEYWKKYPSKDPYQAAYVFLLERFQHFLSRHEEKGLCIVDPRVGQVNKAFINSDLDDIHDSMRWKSSSYRNHCPDIIERVLFSNSSTTIGIQLADLYCYPVFHVHEYNKPTYWRYKSIVYPKLYQPEGKKITEWGLKVFP